MSAITTSLTAYASLFKLRIVSLLGIVAIVTAIVAGRGEIEPGRLMWLAAAAVLSCAGSSALNNYFDRDTDVIMPRTSHRALPTGKVVPGRVLLLGISLIAVSLVVALQLNYIVMLFVSLGALVYVVLYTIWLKKRTWLNITIGGLSGSCAVLGGWFAITTELSPVPFLIALIVFLWTPGHFWSFALVHRESYQQAKIPMLPVVTGEKTAAGYILLHSSLLWLTAPLLYFLGPLRPIYLSGALILGTIFLFSSFLLWRQPNQQRAWRNYKLSGIYLLSLFLVMALDTLV